MKLAYFLFLSVVVAMGQTTNMGMISVRTITPEEECSQSITFRGTTKTIKELFPSECITDEDLRKTVANDPIQKAVPGSSIPIPNAPLEPPKCGTWSKNGKPIATLCSGDDPSYEMWQAIADHCHIEQLVHHRSATDPLPGPVFESPIPTNPASDTWEAVTGMRIVCK
jgi:hypothetical protein